MVVPMRILGTGCALPERVVSTEEVAAIAMPDRDAAWLVARTGIETRRWAPPGTAFAELAVEALARALDDAAMAPEQLKRLILVTSTGGDQRAPPTANLVLRALGQHGNISCFDINNACCGFVNGVELAAHLMAAGEGPIGLVAVELYSVHVRPEIPRPYVVMGDGAAAVVIGEARRDGGVLATEFANDGRGWHSGYVRHDDGAIAFGVSAPEILKQAEFDLTSSSTAVLERAGLERDRIDWAFPHQPNGMMLELFMDWIGVPISRTRPIVREYGSVGSVAVPLALHQLWSEGAIEDGQHVLLASLVLRVERD